MPKKKPAEISTVIFVNKSKEPQTLQVKTKHIARWKHYAALVAGVIVLLVGSVIYLNYINHQQEEEKNRLVAQLARMKLAAPLPVEAPAAAPAVKGTKTSAAQSYIQSIQGKLEKINDYLKRRGLKGFSTKAVGGNGNSEASKLTDEEKYSLYDEYLNRLLHTMSFTPMGYPRVSSLTSYFGYRSDPFNGENAEFHPGIDFKGSRGDEAKCTANGKVVFAGWYGGYGKCVRIAHSNNIETLYGHLSRISVKVGEQVTEGEKIGEIGSTGHSTGTHLHYEVRVNGKPVNPIKFLTLNN